ncbi:MAG: LysM domain-containing protein [Acetivibrio sp.]
MNFEYCEGKVHVVREDDSLYKISREHDVPLALLMRANPYVDVYNLRVGTEVCIPVMAEKPLRPNRPITMPDLPLNISGAILSYVVKEEDTLEDILEKYGVDLEDLLNFNISTKIWLKPGTTLIIPESEEEDE